jgi:hypothetical protein
MQGGVFESSGFFHKFGFLGLGCLLLELNFLLAFLKVELVGGRKGGREGRREGAKGDKVTCCCFWL